MRILVLLILISNTCLLAQTQTESKDLKSILMTKKKREAALQDTTTEMTVGENYISLLPVVGYAPANGVVLGTAISFSKLFDPGPTSISSGMLNAQLTSKHQFIVNARSKIFLNENKWYLQGDWRLLLFVQPTYGLGINDTAGSDLLISINGLNHTSEDKNRQVQDMKFNYIRVYEDVARSIAKDWYAGLGYALDYHYSIVDERLQLDSSAGEVHLTDHYLYSKKNGFNPQKYTTSGINFTVLTDTRDNVANAYKGYLASLSFRVNPTFLGSSKTSTELTFDGRYFLPLSHSRPRHVLAFWTWSTFVTSGNVPYLALPSIGWDTYNRSGRGYIQGRYRGIDMLYAEAEYRFPITSNGLLGGVAFVNNTLASSPSQKLFAKAAPGGGFGLRLKMDKRARTNLTMDVAIGKENSSAIYFNLQETF